MPGHGEELAGQQSTEVEDVEVHAAKIPLQILRLGLSSKEISHVKASKHMTDSRLPPVDVILEREFKAMAARCRHRLCSGRRIVEHIGKLFVQFSFIN